MIRSRFDGPLKNAVRALNQGDRRELAEVRFGTHAGCNGHGFGNFSANFREAV